MSNSDPAKVASSEKLNYFEKFESEREEWSREVSEISKRFRDVDTLMDTQVDLYSKRQQAVEYTHELMVLHARIKKSWMSEWKKHYESLIIDQDYRYSEKERQKFADEKTGDMKLKVDVLQVHIDFFKETTKTIDNMIFGVKHRLEIEDFRRGNK